MKSKRHLKIISLIKDKNIGTQEELVARLHDEGIEVTQATVSRDIKKLGLIKIPDNHGGYKYSLPNKRTQGDINNWLRKMFQDFVIDMDFSENIILLKTVLGTAGGLGAAIDNSEWDGIMGTVAGDDTIFVVIKPKERTKIVFENFQDLLT